MSVIDSLVSAGVINRYQVDSILELAGKHGGDVEFALRDAKIDENAIKQVKSTIYGYPAVAVNLANIGGQLLSLIPESAAKHYRVVPLGYTSAQQLIVGIVDPSSTESLNAIQFIFSKAQTSYVLHIISLTEFEAVLSKYKEAGLIETAEDKTKSDKPGGAGFSHSDEDGLILEPGHADSDDGTTAEAAGKLTADQEKMVTDAPVAQAFNVILSNAIEGKASDIHIEGTDAQVKVRYRVDGDLFTSLSLPKAMHAPIVARVKILSKLKLDEKRKPQDGRFYAKIGSRKIDFRVSTMPTYFGEKVVIRILDPERNSATTLESLGMRDEHLIMVRRALSLPYGMILITGPTGSGKSTTLYSMLQEVDRERKNVVTLEDPVEYNIEGIAQSQVQPEIGYTFASGLRSILRQDPDVIMVGEIRDKETAQLAIQAALTGHLVMSTLHTNTAVGAIPRLIDMGVDPYLIPPVLALTIGQRLVKKLNPKVKPLEIPLEGSIAEMIAKQFSDLPEEVRNALPVNSVLYDADTNTAGSLMGRAAVYEMMEMSRELEGVILKDPTETNITKFVRGKGMTVLREDAILKSMQGVIPFSCTNEL